MEQYWEIKSAHPDKVVLFRMGDFFEMFHDDAIVAAPILNITLTSRNKKAEDETPMCGVPHHSIATPIARLLAAGHKVAICDQVEDPKFAKGIVKRAVTRVLTPGMVYDPDTLDQLETNYLMAFDASSVSVIETSTGEAFTYPARSFADIQQLASILQPAEVVLSGEQKQQYAEWIEKNIVAQGLHVSLYDGKLDAALVSPLSVTWPKCTSAQRLLAYVHSLHGEELLATLSGFEARTLSKRLKLPQTVVNHLELFSTYRGEKKGSLFHAINRTKTSSGARRLKSWLRFPLAHQGEIEERLDWVQAWYDDLAKLKEVRQVLAKMGDIERRLGKISNPNCNALDIVSLADSLRAGLAAQSLCPKPYFDEESQRVSASVVEKIDQTLDDEPSANGKNGGMVRIGYSVELDELVRLSEHSQSLLMEMEMREREQTGISSLKIRYNNVFGYYIEVTKIHSNKVPDRYKRKQTLANAERYITQELQELEDKVLSAKTKRVELEQQIFQQLRQWVLLQSPRLMLWARQWSEMDAYSGLAWLAHEFKYRRPSFSQVNALQLKGSRHPVVEQEVAQRFVANDLYLDQGECLLLTGPNMAGKSTLMRQVAVTCLLAQIGSFVPAEQAIVPIFEQIYTRIGASDSLSEGLSTFMVEMQETSEMLAAANANTLVILDEIGRGTSTYDGMSLAQSILEYLVNKKGSMTLFATHYHELTELANHYPQVKNAHMSIDEKSVNAQQGLRFLYTLCLGPANRSYGIQVAKLAGLPTAVTKRAQQLLAHLEQGQGRDVQQLSLLDQSSLDPSFLTNALPMNWEDDEAASSSVTLPKEVQNVLEEIKKMSLNDLSPIEVLNQVHAWQKQL